MLQAEQDFRKNPESINDIFVRSKDDSMVPLSTVSRIGMMTGPDILQRYNMFRTAEINGGNGPGVSTGEALSIMDEMAAKNLPQGFNYEWTGLSYQEKQAGGTQGPIFGMAMVFVFLVLAAQYESWAVPFSVLLGLPVCVFGALLGVKLVGLENNVYVQIGIVALMGLAAKNAILIVEFAKEAHERRGMGLVEAAHEGARLRFRPIMMTAFAFILGVLPLVEASGAGAAARISIGIAVFAGMLFASTVGLFFIPMLYVAIQSIAYWVGGNRKAIDGHPGAQPALAGGHD
jgi:HAE1 family hydrophobic/amphiphilic exporter-1/multidrug efflux pump